MIWNYTKLILRSTVLYVNLLIGLAGIVTTYYTNVNIPYWIFGIFPFIALFYSGYLIYKNSAPSITIIPPDKDDVEVRYNNSSFNIILFDITLKSRITNFGTRSGSLEDIKLEYVGFNGLKDEFLIKNLMFSVAKPVILKKKPTPIYTLKPWEFHFKYPLIVTVDKNDYLYFYTNFSIDSNGVEIKEALNWLKTLDFELEYKYKDTHKTHIKNSKVIINTNKFYEVYEKAKKEEKDLEEFFNKED